MLIKICGVKDLGTAIFAIKAGAGALGFVFTHSKREITPQKAKKIIQNLPNKADIVKVGVFVDAPISLVTEIAEYCGLDILQFHGTESVDYCQQFQKPVIKAIKVGEKGNLFPHPLKYKGKVKAYLTDTYLKGVAGGTGLSFPWDKIDKIKDCGPVILAGGLNPGNIYQALNITNPYGVDVSSGVETEGRKDPQKIKDFIKEIRRWESEH